MTNDLNITPLHEWHAAQGANMVDFGGWDMPLWYKTGAVNEHVAVVTAAGLFDTSHMAVITVTGADSLALLQECFTRDLASLKNGRCVYGIFLNEDGHAIDDAIVYGLGSEKYMIVVNSGMGGDIAVHIADRAGGRAVQVNDLSGKVGKLDLQGPLAGKIIKKVLKDSESVLVGLPYFSFKGYFDQAFRPETEVLLNDGTPVLLSRSGYTGEFGFELFTAPDKLVHVWTMILEAGQEYNLTACGLASRDSLRAGSLLPLSHQDIGPWPFINNPWSFALPWNEDKSGFTKKFLGDVVLEKRETAEHTYAYVGSDPRKVALHSPDGEPAVVLNEDGERIGVVLTCVADMAVGRVDGKIYSLSSPDKPENFKPRGLACGFIKVDRELSVGQAVVLQDNRRKIKASITDDVRPARTARKKLSDFI